MLFYFVNLFILILYSFYFRKKSYGKYTIVALLHLGGVAAMRSYSVGTDTRMYCLFYKSIVACGNNLTSLYFFSKFPGWSYFFLFVSKLLGDSANTYIFIASFFVVIFIGLAIRKLEVKSIYTMILYCLLFWLSSLNANRQYMAMSMVFFSFALLYKKEYFSGALFGFAAITFHSSAIIGIIICIIAVVEWNYRKVVLALAVTLLFTSFFENIFGVMAGLMEGYSQYELGVAKSQGRGVALQVVFVLTFIYSVWILKKYILQVSQKQLLMKLLLINGIEIILGIVGAREVFIGRINVFFQIFIIAHIPIVLIYKNRYRKLYMAIVMVFSVFYYVYKIIFNYGDIVPYTSYLFT